MQLRRRKDRPEFTKPIFGPRCINRGCFESERERGGGRKGQGEAEMEIRATNQI